MPQPMMRLTCAIPAVLALWAVAPGPAAATEHAGAFPFAVHVTMSAKAQAKLEQIGERIKIAAYYGGYPKPKWEAFAQEGEIALGDEEVELPAQGGTAQLAGQFDARRLNWVVEPRMLINVISARHVDTDNLLDCGLFEDTMAVAQKAPIEIACRLITESN